MKLVLAVAGVVASLVLLITVIGWRLPVKHRASRQATYAASPNAVFDAITKVEDFPTWRSKIESARQLDATAGQRRYLESGSDGDIVYVVDDEVVNHRLTTRIASENLPFGGRWTFELAPAASGTRLRITEDGEVYNPFFRFMSRFVFGHASTVDTYLRDLGRKFGDTAVNISDASE